MNPENTAGSERTGACRCGTGLSEQLLEIYADHYGGEGTDSSRKVTDRGWEETVGRGTCTA